MTWALLLKTWSRFMKRIFLLVLLNTSLLCCLAQQDSPLGQILGRVRSSSLSNDKITAGLKEALQVSTGKAVASTGRPDGYFKTPPSKFCCRPNSRLRAGA